MNRVMLFCVVAVSMNCRNDSDTMDEQVELCVQMCAKGLCSGVVEPGPDFARGCMDSCRTRVSTAHERACETTFQELLECLDGLTCDEYEEWSMQIVDSRCTDEETRLLDECEIDVRMSTD